MSALPLHPVAGLFPPMPPAEYDALVADIREHGQREPVTLWQGQVIDGRHRVRACDDIGRIPDVRTWDGSEAALVGYVVSLNLRRRHLDESQRAMVAARIATLPKGANQHTAIAAPSQGATAAMLGVSADSLQRARSVMDRGVPELIAAVDAGAVAVSTAADVARLTPDVQRQVVARGEEEILRAAKDIRARRATENESRRAEIASRPVVLPPNTFACLVVDPPWAMQKIERDERPHQVGFDYPTMTEDELRAYPIDRLAADDAHLYLWTTHKHLPAALRLSEAWGFTYQCTMTWVKNVGFTPFSWMYSTEHLLFCRRGSLPLLRLGMRLDFAAKVREHSRKPDELYDLVRQASPGPRVDVFSREPREGFAQVGNEVSKFEGAA